MVDERHYAVSKGGKPKIAPISTKLHLHNHRSFFFNVNNFVFPNMTSFGNKQQCCLATTACKPCFVLNVAH